MDLVTFLRARLDEDEQWAGEIGDRSWEEERFGPVRLLAEVAAKRTIIADHRREPLYTEHVITLRPDLAEFGYCGRCHTPRPDAERDEDLSVSPEWPCPTLLALATVHATHPDYDDAWRPAVSPAYLTVRSSDLRCIADGVNPSVRARKPGSGAF